MKYDKFFAIAKEKGIKESELKVSTSYSLNVSLFHSEINNFTVEDGSNYIARGIINGKFGNASCDVYNSKKAEFLVDEIIKNAKVIQNEDPAILFKGSPKYHRVNTFNKKLEETPIDKKIEALYALEKKLKEIDPRIVEVEGVEYNESVTSMSIYNSHGLKLTQKLNYYYIMGSVVAKEGEQVKTAYEIKLGNDFSEVNIDELAKVIANKALAQLGGEPCKSKKYKAVLAPEVISAFASVYVDHASAENVQKQSSLFIGKVGQQVASKKITIEDKPLQKGSPFSRWFDDEGVATYNKPIIKKGILEGYLHNLTTAAKAGVESTGNGASSGSKIGVDTFALYLKPGRKSQEELFAKVKDGVYITQVQGLHAGMNGQSGNFSLQSTGFLIKDGKLDRALDVITISGNLVDVMNDISEVGNDSKILLGGNTFPSVIVKKLAVGGK